MAAINVAIVRPKKLTSSLASFNASNRARPTRSNIAMMKCGSSLSGSCGCSSASFTISSRGEYAGSSPERSAAMPAAIHDCRVRRRIHAPAVSSAVNAATSKRADLAPPRSSANTSASSSPACSTVHAPPARAVSVVPLIEVSSQQPRSSTPVSPRKRFATVTKHSPLSSAPNSTKPLMPKALPRCRRNIRRLDCRLWHRARRVDKRGLNASFRNPDGPAGTFKPARRTIFAPMYWIARTVAGSATRLFWARKSLMAPSALGTSSRN